MALASNGKAAVYLRFARPPSFHPVRALKDFGGQAWFRRKKPDSKVHEGRSKVQAEEQETIQSLYMEFTALNLNRAPLLGVPGAPAGQDFPLKLALLFLRSLYNNGFFWYRASTAKSPVSPISRGPL